MGLDCLTCGFRNADQKPHNCLDFLRCQLSQVTAALKRSEKVISVARKVSNWGSLDLSVELSDELDEAIAEHDRILSEGGE